MLKMKLTEIRFVSVWIWLAALLFCLRYPALLYHLYAIACHPKELAMVFLTIRYRKWILRHINQSLKYFKQR
jgi:hypothetical protein